jgi:hypothetical protein
MTPHFKTSELTCRCGCGLAKFHPGFLDSLEAVRVELGLPMRLTSASRCKLHNDRPPYMGGAGGHMRSLHVGDKAQHPGQEGTLAVDVAAEGSYRGKLFSVAWKHGFSVGWNGKKGFIHLDRRDLIGMPQTSFDY